MRIEIIGEDESTNVQVRTYAEYRLFSILARYTRLIRRARVVLRQPARDGSRDKFGCAVTVILEPSGVVRTRATAGHAYAAIDRAVARIGDLMSQRAAQRLSS